ncbi:MAG: amidohydrolase [Gammaproteobacteria bacterium]|nr:amidohydrolase [Gammaproteobacteria bacterium]MYF67914.1 amidohydrolase [Gammaproteobacteria bacterium]MYK37803.1 amidohydrolase [Gammaproteobacteria bacterium]
MRILVSGAALLALCASMASAEISVSQAEQDYMEELYLHFHRNPELSLYEFETAARMAEEFAAAGYEVTSEVGGTGVVGVLRNGEGPTVMIRGDMDGLPVKELNRVPYASTVTTLDEQGRTVPVMHACGHDIHITNLIGVARKLVSMRDSWSGTVVLVAQPAEERGLGARAMIEDGLFKRFPRPDYNLGLHVTANLPAGQAGYKPEFAMANVDSVDIIVHGTGGHGAAPHLTHDPIVLSAYIVTALQTLVARNLNPIDQGVVTVGSIHGGTKHNIISDRVDLQLTVRSYTDENRALLLEGIARIARSQALAMGLPEDRLPEVIVKNEYTPALFNDPDLSNRLAGVLRAELGDANVELSKPVMGGEDFARFGRTEERIPGFYFWLGAADPEQYARAEARGLKLPATHSPFFLPSYERTLETGVRVMTAAALELLAKT